MKHKILVLCCLARKGIKLPRNYFAILFPCPHFDLRNIKQGEHIAIIGKRCSGLTTLVLDIVKNLKIWPIVAIVAESEEKLYENVIPSQYIYLSDNSRGLERILENQKLRIKIAKKRGINLENLRFLLLLDNALHVSKIATVLDDAKTLYITVIWTANIYHRYVSNLSFDHIFSNEKQSICSCPLDHHLFHNVKENSISKYKAKNILDK